LPSTRLQEELKQTKPFKSPAQEALLSILVTADRLGGAQEDAMKPFGVTATQYNVLRILRGARPGGLPCGEIGCRMVSRVPDVTRLLDRMEQIGLVGRDRDRDDRRVVVARLTAKGLGLVNRMDGAVDKLDHKLVEAIGAAKLTKLSRLLEEVRALLD